jgi:uncharacterized protein YecE (DUF72 family)
LGQHEHDSLEEGAMNFDRVQIKAHLARLAGNGVFIGTSSWKYSGWCGLLYEQERYFYRNKFAQTRFERDCLREYAETFKTVCVDAAYYKFPDEKYLTGLVSQVPEDFQFTLKVTDDITIKRFPNLPRFGIRAGKPNENFLNADLFANAFLKPCEPFRQNIGLLMFEFSRFYDSDYQHGRDFVADLDRFLAELPKGWPYALEMRNKYWLKPEYFECLGRHDITHVFNSWEAMPPVSEQMALPESRTNSHVVAARFLLKPGRKYEDAVKTFQPYAKVQEVNEDARQSAAALIVEGERYEPRRKTFIYINNRLEGNALGTIEGILEIVGALTGDGVAIPAAKTSTARS